MAKNVQSIYWDSSCFLSILNGEENSEICLSILKEAKNSAIKLLVSPLTMAETVRPRGSSIPLSKNLRQQVLDFFENEFIQLINFDREIACQSLELCWEYGLHPRDALHLACALSAQCDALETFDEEFIKKSQTYGLTIQVRKPKGSGQTEIPYC